MEVNGKSAYFIAAKALIRDGQKLLITHDVFGSWDIPGGRIKADEFGQPLEKILDRKIGEELGELVQYSIGKPVVHFQVERIEAGIDAKVGIFAVGYEVAYLGGKVILGPHHDDYRWVDITEFKPETLFEGGWLIGLLQYLAQS